MTRIKNEITQGKKIQKKAEFIWGWGTPSGKRRMERRVQIFTTLGKIEKGKKILEIGCGVGLFTRRVQTKGAQITAIDISPHLLDRARQNINSPDVKFHCCNVEEMPFESNKFDIILGISILHHLNLDNVLSEIRRVLKRGGLIVFSEPNMLNPQIFLMKNVRFIGTLLGEVPEETAFFRWKIGSILAKHGFKNIQVKPFDFLHPFVPGNLVNIVEKIGVFLEEIPLICEIAGSLLIFARK